ncbi:MAG: sulfatase-like hydrolase/transferase, partial [bacterium]|nr:sulfatase-like hydrolase/transferase [bacterium]
MLPHARFIADGPLSPPGACRPHDRQSQSQSPRHPQLPGRPRLQRHHHRRGAARGGDLAYNGVTIAEVLRGAGYATAMVGKWHVCRSVEPDGPRNNWPLQRGFERYYGTLVGAGTYFDPPSLLRDNTMMTRFTDPEYQPEHYYYTDAISDHAVRFISEHAAARPEQPLFMYVAYTTAHWPMQAPEEDIARYKGQYDGGYEPIRRARFERLRRMGIIHREWDLSPQAGDWATVEHKAWEARCMEVYAAMIERMDQGVGRIVAELERRGRLDNTLILFLQDNGACQEPVGRSGQMTRPDRPPLPPIPEDEILLAVIPKQNRRGVPTLMGPGVMPGPEDTYIAYGRDWANVSNTPFREYKHLVHEGGIATPLIAHWPRGIARRGALEHQPGHLVDIMATCVDVGRAAYPAQFGGNPIQPLEGCSLTPAFAGRPLGRKGGIFWEHEGNRAVRDGRWKLVAKGARDNGGVFAPWELYDMKADRTEMHDLAAEQPERVRADVIRYGHAAGDLVDHTYRQAITAAGSG